MAIMCPEVPKEFDPRSREDVIFEALSYLPDSYYVFHSVTVLARRYDDEIEEHESDFLVFHPNKGILCIESKAGQIRYNEGAWRLGDGSIMPHDGPFKQADRFVHTLVQYIKNTEHSSLLRKCKIMGAVCFPTVLRKKFPKDKLPTEADYELILFRESLNKDEIENAISHIFEQHYENTPSKTSLNKRESQLILESFLAPQLNLIPIPQIEHEQRVMRFKTLLNEQTALLDYLEEQRTAVISGAAGTGKTLMAVEKARRNSLNGDRVLFLCYNKKLQEYLAECYNYPNVDFYTIDGYACSVCRTSESDYGLLIEKLLEQGASGTFPYKHIVIDEGQDFGQDKIDENDVVDFLYDLIFNDKTESGSFYLFYDKNQLVQGRKLPDCIAGADCRLTLYRNCRNTENIAKSSLRFLGSQKEPKVFERSIKGSSPVMIFENDPDAQLSALKKMLDEYAETFEDNIVILTCKTVSDSILSPYRNGEYFRYNGKKYLFTTCKKFKGLEADVIIIVDLDCGKLSDSDVKRILYVGTSRAKLELCIIANFKEESMLSILSERNIKNPKNSRKQFAALYNAKNKDLLLVVV